MLVRIIIMPKKVRASKYPKGDPRCVPVNTYVRKVKSKETPSQEPALAREPEPQSES